MLWRAGRPPRGGVQKAWGEPPGRKQRERSRAMTRSAEDGEWSSPHDGGEGTWVPPRRTKVCAGDTVGKSVSDPGRPGIVHREGMAGIVRHSQKKGRETGNAKPGLKPPMVGADISASEIPTEAVPGVGSGRGTQEGRVAKFWRLRLVEPAGGICTSEPEGAHDPERDCREAEAPVEGRLQGPALRGGADPAGRYMVSALPAQLSRHRRAVSGARLGGRPLLPEPVGAGLRAPDREETAGLPQAPLRLNPGRRDIHQDPRPVALPVPGHRQARKPG